MSASVTPAGNAGATALRPAWLVGPWFDALFLANVFWPLVLTVQWWGGSDAEQGVTFWQVYFVTTPHRWITLILVFCDGERMRQSARVYALIALAAAAIVLTVRFSTGALTCLLTIDYIWNAWHFAAQHHGVYRIYGRLAEPDRTRGLLSEKIGMRAFLLYVTLRIAGGTWSNAPLDAALSIADYVVLAIPASLLFREITTFTNTARGRSLYLVSVMTLYVALLWSVHLQLPGRVLQLATAAALFHATEYLAIVTWAVNRKHGPRAALLDGRSGAGQLGKGSSRPSSSGTDRLTFFAAILPRWGLALGMFALILGLGHWMADRHWLQGWLLLNTIAAFLHYTYDAMIWKTRRPGSYA